MKSRCALSVALLLILTTGVIAKDKKKNDTPETLATLHFSVVKDDNGKPVRNASIVLHAVDKDGTQSRGGYQLKTNGEGLIDDEGVPYGMLRVQVLAPGFQTFGEDYDINKLDMSIEIRLKRPTAQFSIYDKGGKGNKQDDGSPQQGTPVQQDPPKN
jgi:hypothetical protein